MAVDRNAGALARYAPYAMVFGLTAPLGAAGSLLREPTEGADPGTQAAGFADRWHNAWTAAGHTGPQYWWDPSQADSHGSAVSGNAHSHVSHHYGGGFHGGHGGGFHGGHV